MKIYELIILARTISLIVELVWMRTFFGNEFKYYVNWIRVHCLHDQAAKSSKSHKTPASSSSSTTPSMTSSSLPVSTQVPVTSSHHSTPVSSTPNSQTNVVRWESCAFLNIWYKTVEFHRLVLFNSPQNCIFSCYHFPYCEIVPRRKEGEYIESIIR